MGADVQPGQRMADRLHYEEGSAGQITICIRRPQKVIKDTNGDCTDTLTMANRNHRGWRHVQESLGGRRRLCQSTNLSQFGRHTLAISTYEGQSTVLSHNQSQAKASKEGI